METYQQAALPEEDSFVETPEDPDACARPRMRLRTILDMMIVGLMIAIMLTLSLPVCMAFLEQSDQNRRREAALQRPVELARPTYSGRMKEEG